jgi:hypothetical protein
MKISKPLPVIALIAILSLSVAAQEPVAAPRHNEGGMTGPNGVEQEVAIKINKLKQGKDIAYIQVDLGAARLASGKPAEWQAGTVTVSVLLGSAPALTGQAAKNGKIKSAQFTGKLVKNGAGLQIKIKKGSLAGLLSDFLDNTGHDTLPLTIQTGTGGVLFSQVIHLDIIENEKTLIARGG